MKQINYTGSSKLIARIIDLLNKKAPLPLDQQGDVDWGTDGKVLGTDGVGGTKWVDPGSGGGDVTDVEVNGTSVVNAQGVAEVTVPTKTSDLNNDSDFIDSTDLSTALSAYTPTSGLSAVATSGDYDDLSNKPSIPTKTSDLANDSDFVSDASYVHTDENFTSAEKTKLGGIAAGAEVNVQSDWNEADSTSDAYIANKPTIPAAQIQSDWTQADNTQADYIKNKPTIPTVNDGTLTIQQNGTTVGTFSANQSGDTTVNLTGGGSGGHTIEDTSGADLPQEDNLQFVGVYTRDDSVNSRTEVNIVRQMTKAAMEALSSAEKEGFIDTTDEDDDYIPISAEDVKYGNTDVESKLDALTTDVSGKVNRSGDTMTGRLNIASVGSNDWYPLVVQSNYANICFARLYDKNGTELGAFGCNEANVPYFRDGNGRLAPIFAPSNFSNTSFTPTDNTRTTLYTNTSGHTQIVFCSVSAEIKSATGIIYLNKNNDGNNPLATAQLTAVDVTNPQYQHVTLTCFVSLANGDAIKYYPVTGGGTLGSHSVVLAY